MQIAVIMCIGMRGLLANKVTYNAGIKVSKLKFVKFASKYFAGYEGS